MNNLNRFLVRGLRGLKRERFFTIVNLLGLSLGMFCFIITAMYVSDELNHDKWHENADNIYLPLVIFNTDNGGMSLTPPYAIKDAWVEESPGVIDAVNISSSQTATYKVNGQEFETKRLFQTSSSLFTVFDYSLKLGDEAQALEDMSSVVISSEIAKKHFEGLNPLGQTITLNEKEFVVTGVLEKIPKSSHLKFEFLTPINFKEGNYSGLEDNWQLGHGLHYILVNENYDLEQLKAETVDIIKKYKGENETMYDYQFNQFSGLYLSGRTWRAGSGTFGGQKKYIYIFSVIGVLMLIVASFNYVNLTTSRSFAKARNLAVRKIIGASRQRLVALQMGETLLIALISLILALIAVEVTQPLIYDLIGKELTFELLNGSSAIIIAVLILATIVLVSGLYPAMIGSKFNMVGLLKGQTPKSGGAVIRKSLIVFQFVICCGLLASALIIRQQANFMINMDMGYNAERVINVDMARGDMFDKYQELKTELERNPMIEYVSGSPLPSTFGAMIFDVGEEGNKNQRFVSYGSADAGFMELYGLELISGKRFADLNESEKENAVMLNEAALALWDFDKETVIGQKIPDSSFKVVGVVKDFHYRSAKIAIGPLMISYDPTQIRNLSMKFKEGNRADIIAYVDKIWNELGATDGFEYRDVEDYYAQSFQREESLIKIFDVLTVMLVVVAFLGLFALATFESQLKEKEMSIRKVLGANNLTLIKVMNSKFAWLIIIAMLVSIPVTQYLISTWLESFPYRIESTVPQYTIAALMIFGCAIGLLSFHGIKNARKNPVEILRNE